MERRAGIVQSRQILYRTVADRSAHPARSGHGAGMVGFVAVTMLVVLIAAFLRVETVMSRTAIDGRELEEYYLAREQELIQEIRGLLEERGFVNSGVMVTRVVESDGSRQYTVTIHHGRIDRMDDEERQSLLCELSEISFADDRCSFKHQFLLGE